jgi:hypothetical protein
METTPTIEAKRSQMHALKMEPQNKLMEEEAKTTES